MRNLTLVVFSLILCGGCGHQDPLPADTGTRAEHAQLESTLQELEDQFQEVGVNVDLRRLPIIITEEFQADAAAICAHDRYIAIRSQTFKDSLSTTGNSGIWRTMLHEIGHCYFKLNHYDRRLSAPIGSSFAMEERFLSNNSRPACRLELNDRISGTVMSINEHSFTKSRALKLYWVMEVAGMVRDPFSDLLNMPGISLVNKSQASRRRCAFQ